MVYDFSIIGLVSGANCAFCDVVDIWVSGLLFVRDINLMGLVKQYLLVDGTEL
jgi:hypothetical protein